MTIPVLLTLLMLPAQHEAPAERPAVESHVSLTGFPARVGHDLVRLGSRESLWTLAIGGVATAAVHPADADTSRSIGSSAAADTVFDAGAVGGNGFVQFAAAGAVRLRGDVEAVGASALSQRRGVRRRDRDRRRFHAAHQALGSCASR